MILKVSVVTLQIWPYLILFFVYWVEDGERQQVVEGGSVCYHQWTHGDKTVKLDSGGRKEYESLIPAILQKIAWN